MTKLKFSEVSSIDDNGLVNSRDVDEIDKAGIPVGPPTLLFHARTTRAEFSRAEQSIHSRHSGVPYWHLCKPEEERYILLKNDSKQSRLVPNGSYIYVVIKDENNQLSLRIGMGRHVFLAQPENIDNVVVAGEIKFSAMPAIAQSAEIVTLNNNSGAFHAAIGDKSIYERRSEHVLHCLEAVGLPIDKFIDVNTVSYNTEKRRKSTA